MMDKGEICKMGDGFIDRCKMRILLCDNDEKSSKEVFTLLCNCSYQVTSVRSPRQVIDALNAEGPDIDIILSEVDLPMTKGFKLLKYITRDRVLQRIPVIMMSARDEISIVVKCLKFGASDYLVKPLRTNELLNLWTHMWRRRRMLGLVEKNILSYNLDMVASDPSDANTNSATLFSDDTDGNSRKTTKLHPETCVSNHQGDETNTTICARLETETRALAAHQSDIPGENSLLPKKNELKLGDSSAFCMYIKSSTPKNGNHVSSSVNENSPVPLRPLENLPISSGQVNVFIQRHRDAGSRENNSQHDEQPSCNNLHDSRSMGKSCTLPMPVGIPQQLISNDEFTQACTRLKNNSSNVMCGRYAYADSYPYYSSGVANQVAMSSVSMYQKDRQDMDSHVNTAVMPEYGHIPHHPHIPGIESYPYYPLSLCLQPGQNSAPHSSISHGNASTNEGKLNIVDRRKAALMKFREKRKERCFDKKIRYVNRKKLADRRPRVRGQFVRKGNEVDMHLNGQPVSAEEAADEEETEEED